MAAAEFDPEKEPGEPFDEVRFVALVATNRRRSNSAGYFGSFYLVCLSSPNDM